MRKTEIKYTWDEATKTATAEQIIGNKYIYGEAVASPKDYEFANKYTGCAIAELRMTIDLAKQHIEYDLKPQLAALNHLLGTMTKSPRFNPNSYEAKRIYAERQNLLDDIEQFKSYIATTKDCINDYIAEKDVLYRELEQGRK